MGQKSSGGNKKAGRNKDECALYRAKKTKERNQLKHVRKHLLMHPGDTRAEDVIERIQAATGLR